MNDWRKMNLELLDKKYPGIAVQIEEKQAELLAEEDLEVMAENALNGERILKVCKDGRCLYLGGKREPKGPVTNQMSMLGKIEHTAPVFLVGLGNVFYLEALQEFIYTDTMLLIYEPSFSVFLKQLEDIDFSAWFEKGIVVLIIGGINDDKDTLQAFFSRMLQGDRVPIMKHLILPNYEEICNEKVYQFMKLLNNMARGYRINQVTGRHFSDIIVNNIFHNVGYLRTNYRAGQLESVLPKDIPAIIVSAGPSLNKNIAQLKQAKNKAFIIAVDTAIKPLIKAGIIPDMYATIDGKKVLELVTVEESRNIPLITTIEASSELLAYHRGKKFFFREGYLYVNHLYELFEKKFETLPMGGSVATLAFSLACHLGYKTIILVGQDLAYTGNKSHADGTFKEVMEEEDTSKYLMVPGNYEEKVPTRKDFNEYRIWFEEFIDGWKKRYYEIRVINATEGGARIEGTELLTLEEAIMQECEVEADIAYCIEKLKPAFSEEEQAKILEYFYNTPNEFQKIIKLAGEGKKLYKKLERMCVNGNVDQKAYLKLLHKVKKNVKKIEAMPEYQLVSLTMERANQILKTAQYFEYQSFEEEAMQIAKKGILFMELIGECAEILRELATNVFLQNRESDVVE